jgi:hypothetical protein
MPDPTKLKVGDKVKFVAVPDEWNAPGRHVHPDSVAFMKAMIGRTWPSRVWRIHEDGYPWIQARMRDGDRIVHHEWGIYESTGWRLVRKRL